MVAALIGVGSAVGIAIAGGLYRLGSTIGRVNQTMLDLDRRLNALEAPVIAASHNLHPRRV